MPDSITVSINPLPVVSLGPDTLGCGDSLTLTVPTVFAGQTYTWAKLNASVDDFTQINQNTIRVVTGSYILTAEID